MRHKEVAFVIINLNNAGRLKRCLESILNQDYPKHLFSIVLVDNGSQDESTEVATDLGVRVIHESVKSPYSCRNKGILNTKSELLAFIDSNCIPSKQWLSAAVDVMDTLKADIITGPLHFEFDDRPTLFERFDFLNSTLDRTIIDEKTALPGGHLLIKRQIFDEIGLFIGGVRSLADIEWTKRAHAAGYAFGFSKLSSVSYPPKKLRAFISKYIRLGKGSKEIRKATNRPWRPYRIWYVLKHFLPPSPTFMTYLRRQNSVEKTDINVIQLFFLAWFLKILRGIGLLS